LTIFSLPSGLHLLLYTPKRPVPMTVRKEKNENMPAKQKIILKKNSLSDI